MVLDGANIAEKFNLLLRCTNVTDRRQTDGFAMTQNERNVLTFAYNGM